MENSKLPADILQDIENAAKLYATYGQIGPVSMHEAKYLIHKGASTEWAEKWWEVKQCEEAQTANVEILLKKSNRLQEENEKLKVALEKISCYDSGAGLIAQAALASYGKEGKPFTRFKLVCHITAIPLSVLLDDGQYFKAGNQKRFVAFRWDEGGQFADLSIREDGDTRYVFNGRVHSIADFQKAWDLTM